MQRRRFLGLTALALMAACGTDRVPVEDSAASAARPSSPAPTSAGRPRVVALGDSLTAGLGLSPDQAWPALVQTKADAAGFEVEIVNAGVSGDTTAGGRRRLEWALDGDVRVLVLELGANDGLRGLPVDQMRENLGAMIRLAKARDIAVLLCGMEAPPNFGPAYTAQFRKVYADLAREHDVAFLPFFLDGVAGDATLNQADGIHPNEAGTRRVADLVWRSLEPLLTRALASS